MLTSELKFQRRKYQLCTVSIESRSIQEFGTHCAEKSSSWAAGQRAAAQQLTGSPQRRADRNKFGNLYVKSQDLKGVDSELLFFENRFHFLGNIPHKRRRRRQRSLCEAILSRSHVLGSNFRLQNDSPFMTTNKARRGISKPAAARNKLFIFVRRFKTTN